MLHLRGPRHAGNAQKQGLERSKQMTIAGYIRDLDEKKAENERKAVPVVSPEERSFRLSILQLCLAANIQISQIGQIADHFRSPNQKYSMPKESVIREQLIPLALEVEEDRVRKLIVALEYVVVLFLF